MKAAVCTTLQEPAAVHSNNSDLIVQSNYSCRFLSFMKSADAVLVLLLLNNFLRLNLRCGFSKHIKSMKKFVVNN